MPDREVTVSLDMLAAGCRVLRDSAHPCPQDVPEIVQKVFAAMCFASGVQHVHLHFEGERDKKRAGRVLDPMRRGSAGTVQCNG